MPTATRLETDMSHWSPVSRHYAVDGGYLTVTVNRFLTAEGTDVYFCDERAIAPTMEPIAEYPEGTSHTEALELLGYTVVDNIGEESTPAIDEIVQIQQQSIFDMLPAPIAAMIAAGTQEEQP